MNKSNIIKNKSNLFLIISLIFFVIMLLWLYSLCLFPEQRSIDQVVLDKYIIVMLKEIELGVTQPLTLREFFTMVLKIVAKHVYIGKYDFFINDQTLFIHRLLKRVHEHMLENPDYFPLKALQMSLVAYGETKCDSYFTAIDSLMYHFNEYWDNVVYPF